MKFQGHHFPFNLNFILFLKIISMNTMYGMLLLFLMCNKKLDESRNFVRSFITLLLMSSFCNKRYFVFCFIDTKVVYQQDTYAWMAWNLHHLLGRKAPSLNLWLPPWSISHLKWLEKWIWLNVYLLIFMKLWFLCQQFVQIN